MHQPKNQYMQRTANAATMNHAITIPTLTRNTITGTKNNCPQVNSFTNGKLNAFSTSSETQIIIAYAANPIVQI